MLQNSTNRISSCSSAIDEGNPTTSIHSRRDYWAFFEHYLSTDTICLHKMLLTFLMTATSDSSFFKFSLRFFIFSEFIIPLVCSVEFKNSSVSWVLYNVLCVFSVYSSHIVEEYYNDTKWLNKNFTFFSHRSC